MPSSQRAYVPPTNFPASRFLTLIWRTAVEASYWFLLAALVLSLAYIAYCSIEGWGLEGAIDHFMDQVLQRVRRW
jgi:hypothetical protein